MFNDIDRVRTAILTELDYNARHAVDGTKRAKAAACGEGGY
jgi:hypothetical protein